MIKKKKFTVYGNCQAAAIAHQLMLYPAFSEAYEYVQAEPCFLVTPDVMGEWVAANESNIDLLITQNLRSNWRNHDVFDIDHIRNHILAPGGQVVRYTDIYHRGTNPLLVYPISFERSSLCDYTDLISITTAAHGIFDAKLLLSIYNDDSFISPSMLKAIQDLAELALLRRERGLEIQMAEDIASIVRDIPAFHTFNHPGAAVLQKVTRSIIDAIGLSADGDFDHHIDPLSTVLFPLPSSIAIQFRKPSETLNVEPNGGMVQIESGPALSMLEFFATSSARFSELGESRLRAEKNLHAQDPISAILINRIEQLISDKLAISHSVLTELNNLSEVGITRDFIETKANPQALGFMTDIVGFLRNALLPKHVNEHFSVLDLGAKSAVGANFLGQLGQPNSFSKLKFTVTAADIDLTYQKYSEKRNVFVTFDGGDVFEMGRSWDIVICSHVIEHIVDTEGFIARLRTIANKYIVLAFPFAEDPNNLISEHVRSLDIGFLRALKPVRYEVYDGMFWTQSLCCIVLLEI